MKKRNSQKNRRRAPGPNVNRSLLSDGPAYAGQQKVVLTLEGSPGKLTTTVTTGVIAAVSNVASASIIGFATRFGSTFDEYRILSATYTVFPLSVTTGVSKYWWDEKDSAAPTLLGSQERIVTTIPNTNGSRNVRPITWRARDLVDLEYLPIGTATSVATWKLYTDATNYGAPATVTDIWLVQSRYVVEFRGIKST